MTAVADEVRDELGHSVGLVVGEEARTTTPIKDGCEGRLAGARLVFTHDVLVIVREITWDRVAVYETIQEVATLPLSPRDDERSLITHLHELGRNELLGPGEDSEVQQPRRCV